MAAMEAKEPQIIMWNGTFELWNGRHPADELGNTQCL